MHPFLIRGIKDAIFSLLLSLMTLVFAMATVAFGVMFAGLNAAPVTIDLTIGQFTTPLSMLVVVTLGIGILIGLLSFTFVYIRQKAENIRLRKRVRLFEQEVDNLRSIPLKDTH